MNVFFKIVEWGIEDSIDIPNADIWSRQDQIKICNAILERYKDEEDWPVIAEILKCANGRCVEQLSIEPGRVEFVDELPMYPM